MSTLNPFTFQSATDSDADKASGDSVSLARSISKDSLASNILNITPKHQMSVSQPPQAGVRRVNGLLADVRMEDEEQILARTDVLVMPKRVGGTQATAAVGTKPSTEPKPSTDTFFLEPLMPAMIKTAKEKSVCVNKEEESGEGPCCLGRGSIHRGDGSTSGLNRKAPCSLNQTFIPSGEEEGLLVEPPQSQASFRPIATSSVDSSCERPAGGIYLHSEEPQSGQALDADLEELDEDEEDLDEAVTIKDPNWTRKAFIGEEEESAKLQEDMNVKEHEDKDLNGGSGCSSPCLSNHSQASSMASSSVRMTSFAERKAQQHRFGSNHDLCSSASSSQRTTPDGSESSGPLNSWRLKRDQSPSSPMGGWSRTGDGSGTANVLASELVQLHMQLEEKRRAIEHQKKKRDLLSARQRQKLGKAAFLHIVKKDGGKSDSFPNPLKADISKDELGVEKGTSKKEYMCADTLKRETNLEGATLPGNLEADERGNGGKLYLEEELDPFECSRSIEQLNEAISSIQQQMMQVSLKQEMLMKQNVPSPPGASPPTLLTSDRNGDSKASTSFHIVDHVSGTSTAPTRKPPKLSSGRGSRSKPSELKVAKEQGRQASRTPTPTQSVSKTLPQPRQLEGGRSSKTESPRTRVREETIERLEHVPCSAFRLHDEANIRLPTRVDLTAVVDPEVPFDACLSSTARESELNSSDGSGKENIPSEDLQHSKALIEVDLSELKAPEEDEAVEDRMSEGGDGEQKSVMGFFFKVMLLHRDGNL